MMSHASVPDAVRPERTSWPLPEERLLLEAGTAPPEAGLEAFRAWARLRPGPVPSPERRLLPLAWWNLRSLSGGERALEAAGEAFRAAWVDAVERETSAASVLASLGALGTAPVLLKGAALVASGTVPAGARPMADVDVLVEPGRLDEARSFLLGAGFTPILPTPEGARARLHSEGLRRDDGLVFDLHAAAFASHRAEGADDPLLARALAASFAGAPVRVPAPEDHLLLICWHGLHWSDAPAIHWVTDALLLLRQAGDRFDWAVFTAEAVRRGIAAPAARALRFLTTGFGAQVPPDVLLALDAAPGGFLGRLEAETIARPPSLAGGLLIHWLSHRRARPGSGLWSSLVRFPRYLARMWGVDTPARVPGEAVARIRSRIRKAREART
jgi:hypothetical protein